MKLDLIELTKEITDNTIEEWRRQLDAMDAPGTEYNVYLDWVKGHIETPEYVESNHYFYGLVNQSESHPYALAVVHISHAVPNSPKAWIKVLTTRYEPNVREITEDDSLDRLVKVVTECFAQVVSLITDPTFKVKTVKLYAETEQMTTLYRGMAATLTGLKDHGINVKYYGKWLEFQVN